jgi:hypothetical protein
MICLTLRSGRDGSFLARVVDQGGRPFVLDYGDTRVIEDLVQRITRGFTLIRQGRLLHVHPGDADLLIQIAGFYAEEGALVFFEEPTWSGRQLSSERRPRVVVPANEGSMVADDEDPTETIAFSDIPAVDDALLTDEITAERTRSGARREGRQLEPVKPAKPKVEADEERGLLPSVPFVSRRGKGP